MAKFGRLLGGLVGVAVLASAAMASAGTVRGKGRVMYYSGGSAGGQYLPLAGARVHLIDDDGLVGDDTLRTSFTDSNGYFDMTGSDDDGWLGGKLDPYIQVELESSGGKVVVESEVLKNNVTCSTGVREGTEGTIEFGTFNCAGTEGKDASAIYAYMNKTYAKFQQLTGQVVPRHNGKAAVLFPVVLAAGVPYTTEESIHWPGSYKNFSAVYHEFGHRVRHAQDGDFFHFLGDVASYSYMQHHWMTKATNNGFAFNEGWAEYHSSVHDAGDASTLARWTPVSGNANNVEGNVAAKLFKLHTNCGGFAKMWSNLKKGGIHSYTDFANKLKAEFQASSTLRTQYPNCLSNFVASAETTSSNEEHLASSHNHGFVGASAPVGERGEGKASEADQTSALTRMIDAAKAQASRRQARNRLSKVFGNKLRGLGDKLSEKRESFERGAVGKLETHLRGLRPIASTKEALEARKAANLAFIRGVIQDRIASLQDELRQLETEKGRRLGGRDEQMIDRLKAKVERLLTELREAARTGEIKRHHLPRSFSLATEAGR